MMGKEYKYKHINAVLKHGGVFKVWMWIVSIVLSIASLILWGGACLVILLYSTTGKTFLSEDIPVIVGAIIVGIMIFCGSICVIVKQVILKNHILTWLEDAVELQAVSTEVDRRGFGTFAETKICIRFSYEDTIYKLNSGNPTINNHFSFKHNGYYKVFGKYSNRNIIILFSPKYGEVMIPYQ